jgi:CRP-like cAMP-binding protein
MNPLIDNLTPSQQEIAIKYFKEENFDKDEYIVKEGEKSDKAFILISGEVEIIKLTIYKDDYVIDKIKAPSNNIFGEINLIDRGNVTSTIKTTTKTTILSITHDDFKDLIFTYPDIGIQMLWIITNNLAKHLRKADNEIITLFNALIEVVEND